MPERTGCQPLLSNAALEEQVPFSSKQTPCMHGGTCLCVLINKCIAHILICRLQIIGGIGSGTHQCTRKKKKCVEIAVRCVEVDRHSRPAINDIIHELKQTEIYTRAVSSSQDQV